MSVLIFSISLKRQIAPALAATLGLGLIPQIAAADPMHAIAMIGKPALPQDFAHFPYANPDAPKGGRVTYGVVGTFDSLNPFVLQGGFTSARGLRDPAFGNLVFESLLARNEEEPFTLYGLIAESIETPADRSWVEFTLNPNAEFSDGQPVTVDDVIFSLETLRDKRALPNFVDYYSQVEKIDRVGDRGVRFHIEKAKNRELPLLLGLMPILPRHAVNLEKFYNSTLTPPIGSGPYRIAEVKPPDYILYKRNPDYWAKDLPVKRGFDNYDEVKVEFYRDANTMFEAFKKGLYDIHPDGDPPHWHTGYDFPAATDGRVVKETFRTATPKGMSGFAFNTRRPIFADIRVRRALAQLFDFEWVNKNLYFGSYTRAASYFGNSELSALGRPADEREKALLAPFPDVVAPDIMDGTYRPSSTDGSGGDRGVMRSALNELGAAGYKLDGSRLVDAYGKQFAFEILVTNKEDERLAIAYQRTLSRVGIATNIRTVNSAQYQSRRKTFDFDMVRATWGSSLSPGNEQMNRWGQASATAEGSLNYPGVNQPAVDGMVTAMLGSATREEFVAAVRALDRVLMSGYYVVPLFYLPDQWIARWTRLEHPAKNPLPGASFPTWWIKSGG